MKSTIRILIIPVVLFMSGCNGVTKDTKDVVQSSSRAAPEMSKKSPVEESPAQKAANFVLPDLNNNLIQLSDFKGKVIILDFWATWCPPCTAELPHFKALYAEYYDQGLEIVGVALDKGGAAVLKPFVQKNEIPYPILIGNNKVTAAYGGIRGIPTTFVIDRQGRIIKKLVGYHEKEVFESLIKTLL